MPHQRSLVERMKGRPFVLLGINADEDQATAQRFAAEQGVTWRSWWDGKQGPIATDWEVRQWPTPYLIDPERVIRNTTPWLRSVTIRTDAAGNNRQVHLLDEAVEKLVAEAEAAK